MLLEPRGGSKLTEVYRLEEYIPDSMYEYYDAAREAVVSVLMSMGVLKKHAIAHDGPREYLALS